MSQSTSLSGSKKISSVETIRGMAALSVCLYHFSSANISFVGSSSIFKSLVSKGYLGVEAFFVLSGFIIPYSLSATGYKLDSFLKFFSKRCLRIEPPFIVSIVMVLVLWFLSSLAPSYSGAPFEVNIPQVLSHVAYLTEHLGFNYLQPVYWTLEAEFHYYLIIGLLFPLMWKNNRILTAVLVSMLLSSIFVPLYVFRYMPLFVMGISLCAWRTGRISKTYLIIAVLLSFTLAIVKETDRFIAIAGALTTGLISIWDMKSKVTDFFGKISYSLYLVHVPVGSRVLNYLGRYTREGWQVWASLALALCIVVTLAWLFNLLVETPSQKLSKKIRYDQRPGDQQQSTSLR